MMREDPTTTVRLPGISSRSRVVGDVFWVGIGQVASAGGALISIRIMTELLPPEGFGRLTLLVGVVALAFGLAVNSRLQALGRYYPEWVREGRLHELRRVSARSIQRMLAPVAALAAIGFSISALVTKSSFLVAPLVVSLLVVDAVRSFELGLFNAARRQREASWIQIADAWARPLSAMATVGWAGPTVEAALGGYVLGSALVALVLRFGMRLEGRTVEPDGPALEALGTSETIDLAALLSRYSWPLVPLALFGWLGGMGDRYVIGAFLGLAQTGLYAAAYGLASRPFLMFHGIVEQTLRPILQNVIASRNREEVERVKRVMVIATSGGAALGVVAFVGLGPWLGRLLLAEEYRDAVDLMPWIALGYGFYVTSNVFSRFCYAFDDTRAVLGLTVAGALLGVAVLLPAALLFDVQGVVAAVPVRFGLELLLSVGLARRAERRFWARRRESS